MTNCNLFHDLLDLPDEITNTWQTVNVSGIGSFKIPTEWYAEQQGEVIFITDKPRESEDYTLYLIGVVQIIGEEADYTHPHEIFESAERGELVRSAVYSNSSQLRIFKYKFNGVTEEKLVIYMPNVMGDGYNFLNFLVWNQAIVDEFLASDIAKTYRYEEH